ncbi:MAG: response regulator [Anaerolineae bacterium]|nr:response regulator [Anaerolineae bacterium]MDQ7034623.1 response regulator [Anaerolineae bacterium]
MTNRRVLVVEDDPDGQEMITTMLQHMKFVVDAADNGEQAATLLFDSGTSYNAVIIDLALPGKDGWELLSEVIDNPRTENLPCIAVTAFHNSKLREEALRAGFVAYFPKPLDGTQLGRELDRLI